MHAIKMKEKRKHVGSYENIATRWGQLVAGYHIVSTQYIGHEGRIIRSEGGLSDATQDGRFNRQRYQAF